MDTSLSTYYMKHIEGQKCDLCEETHEILLDEVHAEIFCAKCGFVLRDNSFLS